MHVETFTIELTEKQASIMLQSIQSYMFTVSSAVSNEEFTNLMKQMHPVQGQLIHVKNESLRMKYADLNQKPEIIDMILRDPEEDTTK